jgi:hypothetical protein
MKAFLVLIRDGAYEALSPHPSGFGSSVTRVGAEPRPNADKMREIVAALGGWRGRPQTDGSEVWCLNARYREFNTLKSAGFVMSNGDDLRFPGRDGSDWIRLRAL